MINSSYIHQLTRNQNSIKLVPFCPAKYCRTSAWKKNVILLLKSGRCTFKYLTIRKEISSIYIMTIAILFVLSIWKIKLSWNILTPPSCCVHILLDWSPIMLSLVNINKSFSLIHQLYTHVITLLLG